MLKLISKSTKAKNRDTIATTDTTAINAVRICSFVGKITLESSARDSLI